MFFERLKTELSKISVNHNLFIDQKSKFNYDIELINNISNSFIAWLKKKERQADEIFRYENKLNISFLKSPTAKKYIIYHPLQNTIHDRKISGVVIEKLKNYNEALKTNAEGIIICIDLLFDSVYEPDDYIEEFRAVGSVNIDTNTCFSSLGHFYLHPECSRLLGLVILYNKKYHWIRNYRFKDYMEE